MASPLLDIITSPDAKIRNLPLDAVCARASAEDLRAACEELEAFRRRSDNLYERVRALFFLYAIHRFHLPGKLPAGSAGMIPFKGYEHLLQRRFEEALDQFLGAQRNSGPSDALCSALAAVYQRLGFQTLADQVRRSVRSVRGNQWMFRMGHPADHPLRIRPELAQRCEDGTYPVLRERTPVRMDLSHSGWSDIFFLGMDFPEGARVLNVSIDLGVHGRDPGTQPPVEACLRVIDEPVLRLTSVDLGATAEITQLAEVFDFARDYLGLLKAAVIAAGIVPPGIEGSGLNLAELLARVVGAGRGLELVSHVNDIPKGSRLAVSTNLLAALISVCMRATGQAKSLTGALAEEERRLVLARALLGEWLGGSGGGWQDSGGVWPGMKLICGVAATEGDAEFGISRGRLMPAHRILDHGDVSPETRERLQQSLVLVHGGMAQNVGPILEMVTEKYLLRCAAEWAGRQQAIGLLDEMLTALRAGMIYASATDPTRTGTTRHQPMVVRRPPARKTALQETSDGVPARRSRSRKRWIFPVVVLGSSGRNSIHLGYLNGASLSRTECWSARARSGDGAYPARRTTNARGLISSSRSALPTTAASSTAECSTSAASTSAGETHCPPTLSMSSDRPQYQ